MESIQDRKKKLKFYNQFSVYYVWQFVVANSLAVDATVNKYILNIGSA